MLFIGAAAGFDHNGVDPAPIWHAAQFATTVMTRGPLPRCSPVAGH
jgi:hypothetical protein